MRPRSLPVALHLYRGAASAAGFLAPAWLGYRVRKGKEDPARLAERRGIASQPRPSGPLVWMHGASVGEIISLLPLAEKLTSRGFTVLVTSGTLTSSRIAAERLPKGAIHQFVPLDALGFIRRFLDHWTPDLVLVAESELWPNLFCELGARSVPLVLVNGRLSARSAKRWGKLPLSARALLSRIDLCLAQSASDAARFRALGAARVMNCGNLKFDVPPPGAERKAFAEMAGAARERPVFLAASTHPGEDEQVLEAHRMVAERLPDLLTIIAPRHPERGPDIAALAEVSGLEPALRSAGELPGPETAVYVADTIGELGLFYRLAPVVFVGGSLVAHGGQNPIEPAKLGAALLHGPHVSNFAAVYDAIAEARGAIEVAEPVDLARFAYGLLKDRVFREATTAGAARAVVSLGGALDRTLAAIEPYLVQIRLHGK